MIRLFTSFYPESDPQRRDEIIECINRNVANEAIDEVCLLLEGVASPSDRDNVLTRDIVCRPTYAQLFDWARELIQAESDISIICNSDIFFDDSIRVLDRFAFSNQCFALSRWDVLNNNAVRLFEHGDSQDCWIFSGPIKDVRGDFPIGVYDCDNKIAWELEQGGYRVTNPALSIRSYHLHQTELRSYDPVSPTDHGIRPPYRYVEPDNIGSFLQCARLWRSANMPYFPWRITRKKLLRTPPGKLWTRIIGKLKRLRSR